MKRTDYKPVKFLGADETDLQIISAYLQDMLVQIRNVAWLPEMQRFAVIGNRFCRELSRKGQDDRGPYFRVQSGCHFDDIISVRSKNIDLTTKDAVFSILSIMACEDTSDTPSHDQSDRLIGIHCGGGGMIELRAAAINVTLSDISDPWPTQSRPDHARDSTTK